MKKGFTLIELLAVIVILAIIALIATPIILNIINDSKEESNKRSVELYGKAVEQAIAKSQLNGGEIAAGDLSSSLLSTVEYSGNEVTCTTNKLYEDGSIYLAGCRVGTDTKEYPYGTQQVTTIYRWGTENISIGDIVEPTEYTTDASTLNKKQYLKHVLNSDNEVIESWACAVFSGQEYCLDGSEEYGYVGEYDDNYHEIPDYEKFTGNVKKLYDIQSSNISGVSCYFSESNSSCDDGSVGLNAYSDGYLFAFGDNNPTCDVFYNGGSYCESW